MRLKKSAPTVVLLLVINVLGCSGEHPCGLPLELGANVATAVSVFDSAQVFRRHGVFRVLKRQGFEYLGMIGELSSRVNAKDQVFSVNWRSPPLSPKDSALLLSKFRQCVLQAERGHQPTEAVVDGDVTWTLRPDSLGRTVGYWFSADQDTAIPGKDEYELGKVMFF